MLFVYGMKVSPLNDYLKETIIMAGNLNKVKINDSKYLDRATYIRIQPAPNVWSFLCEIYILNNIKKDDILSITFDKRHSWGIQINKINEV